jgi:hypothetical protein
LRRELTNALLAARTQSKEFEFVGDSGEPALVSNRLLEFGRKTALDFDHVRTPGADQVMVVAIVALRQQFKPCPARAKIEPFDHVHTLEEVQRAIDRGQIAITRWQRLENLASRKRTGAAPENVQDRLAGAGDLV